MTFRDGIILSIASTECRRVADIAQKALEAMSEGLQSGDDTPLINIWEEVCVQIQDEASCTWEAYENTMLRIIERIVNVA